MSGGTELDHSASIVDRLYWISKGLCRHHPGESILRDNCYKCRVEIRNESIKIVAAHEQMLVKQLTQLDRARRLIKTIRSWCAAELDKCEVVKAMLEAWDTTYPEDRP